MPGRDGTGPAAMGPMTGGGRGFCIADYRPGAGYGGRCAGVGRRGRFNAPVWRNIDDGMPPQVKQAAGVSGGQNMDALEKRLESLERALEQVKKSISDLADKE